MVRHCLRPGGDVVSICATRVEDERIPTAASPSRGLGVGRRRACSTRSRTMFAARSLALLLVVSIAAAAAAPSPHVRARRQLADDNTLQPLEVCPFFILRYAILPAKANYTIKVTSWKRACEIQISCEWPLRACNLHRMELYFVHIRDLTALLPLS